jgi:hypothetical protein
MVVAFALVMGIAGTIFYYIGVSMGWLYTFMGVLLGSAVVPIALCITWRKANKLGCIAGAVTGLIAGIIAWLVTTSQLNSEINVTTSGGDYEMLAGNLAAIGVGGIVATVWSYISPDDFDFNITRSINAPDEQEFHKEVLDSESLSRQATKKGEKDSSIDGKAPSVIVEEVVRAGITSSKDLDVAALKKAFRFAAWSSVVLTIIMIILIPLPLFFASTIYNVPSLKAWVIIAIIWAFCAAFTVVLYPLWESRVAITMVVKGIIKDIFSPGSGKYVEKEPTSA